MDENEVNDTTNPNEGIVNNPANPNENIVEENTNDGLVEVIEEEVEEENDENKDTENIQTPNNAYPSSASKLTGAIYLIIFISILIGVYFYVTQNNNEILNKILGKENTQTGEIDNKDSNIVNTNSTNDTTDVNTGIETDNTNLENIEGEKLLNDNKGKNEKEPSTETNTTGTSSKSEEVIIKDFEKELDSLFDIIDENAK